MGELDSRGRYRILQSENCKHTALSVLRVDDPEIEAVLIGDDHSVLVSLSLFEGCAESNECLHLSMSIARYVRFPRVVLDDTVTDRTETFMRSEDRLLGLNVRRYALPCSNPDMALSEKVLLPAILWDVFLA